MLPCLLHEPLIVTAQLFGLGNRKRIAYYKDSKLKKEEEGKEAGMLRPAI
jgi:hypothetical protein